MTVQAGWRGVFALALGCGVLAACTTGSHGSTPTSPRGSTGTAHGTATGAVTEPAQPAAASARAALGDFRTLDPCSLVEPGSLGALGRVSFGDPQSLDYCVVRVAGAVGDVEVHVGQLVSAAAAAPSGAATPAPRATQRLAGGPLVTSGSPGPAGCADQLTFNDAVALLTTADPVSGPATTTTCRAADSAMQGVLDRISGGGVSHRAYPKGSFGPVDACAVLTAKVAAGAVPSLGTADAGPYPAGHECDYGAAQSAYVSLVLAAAYARFDGGPTSTTATVAHHPVVFVPEQPDDRAGECVGYGPHIAFPSRSGQGAMEMAELHIALPTGASDAAACAAVRSLAGPVFAHLP